MKKIIFHKKCLEYGRFHTESAERVGKSFTFLKERGYEFLEPDLATEEELLLVHSRSYIEKVKKGEVTDTDTPPYENIYEYARLAAGGAIKAAKVNGFSLMRPPGHHSGKEGISLGASTRGYCYFNNIAIAVRSLGKSALILDIDGHHGNGTEEIFLGDEKTTFVSLHRSPLYPSTGLKSRANCFNFPLQENCGEKDYLQTLEGAMRKIDIGKIEIIAVSAGFDGCEKDRASLGLTVDTFGKIAVILQKMEKPVFFVLEGGYIGENMGPCVDKIARG